MTVRLSNTNFNKILLHENSLDEKGFSEWVFSPGMLFKNREKWWGDQGRRETAHEGIDLLAYKDSQDNINHLDETIKVPAIYDGHVLKIMDDFLGKTVIIEHALEESRRLYAIYGHVTPLTNIQAGDGVRKGDVIATISAPGPKAKIPAHLHITIGWASTPVPAARLDWNTIGCSDIIELIDPLQLFEGHYSILSQGAFTKKRANT